MAHYLLAAVLLFGPTEAVIAQWIPIRTVPLIAADQGDFSPSIARGMGNLTFILDDPLRDPFLNPAKAGTLRGTFVFTSPSRNSWTNDQGRAVGTFLSSSQYKGSATSSLPFGGFSSWGDFFGGAVVAYQGLASERVTTTLPSPWVSPTPTYYGSSLQNDLGSNTYLFGVIGHRFPNAGISVGGSISWATFGALDGVQLLYPGSLDVRQDGHALETKIGVTANMDENNRLEFLAGRALFKATHQVTSQYLGPCGECQPYPVIETNSDERNDWILQGVYVASLHDAWKLGAIAAVNWKDHPKLPNYRLANIPRDPGTSVAYNVGIGTSWSGNNSFWGLEYIYEPIRSNTWSEFGERGVDPPAPLYPPDFKAIENFFDFSNHIIRIGHQSSSEVKWKWLEYRFGAQFHIYNYSLTQSDNVWKTSRIFETGWLETTLSGGLTAHIGQVDLMYTLQLVLGNGTVGNNMNNLVFAGGEIGASNSPDFLIAPAGDLVLDNITLVTQQLAVVFSLD